MKAQWESHATTDELIEIEAIEKRLHKLKQQCDEVRGQRYAIVNRIRSRRRKRIEREFTGVTPLCVQHQEMQ